MTPLSIAGSSALPSHSSPKGHAARTDPCRLLHGPHLATGVEILGKSTFIGSILSNLNWDGDWMRVHSILTIRCSV